MSVDSTIETMTRYFDSEHSDVNMMADDVVFTIMATGQEHHGREGVMGMLNYFYHIVCFCVAQGLGITFCRLAKAGIFSTKLH